MNLPANFEEKKNLLILDVQGPLDPQFRG